MGRTIGAKETEIRPLSDAELDGVNGGWLAAVAIGFGIGFAVGAGFGIFAKEEIKECPVD